jgi:DNA-binding LytR/AlgR family response regulator
MLRTMITDAPFEQTWVLQGRLCGRWATDLRERWNAAQNERQGRKCVVNLEDVTWVDSDGENLLRQMLDEGCQLVASRAYTKYVLDTLKADRSFNHVDR